MKVFSYVSSFIHVDISMNEQGIIVAENLEETKVQLTKHVNAMNCPYCSIDMDKTKARSEMLVAAIKSLKEISLDAPSLITLKTSWTL